LVNSQLVRRQNAAANAAAAAAAAPICHIVWPNQYFVGIQLLLSLHSTNITADQ
jgi:hypothetical protein